MSHPGPLQPGDLFGGGPDTKGQSTRHHQRLVEVLGRTQPEVGRCRGDSHQRWQVLVVAEEPDRSTARPIQSLQPGSGSILPEFNQLRAVITASTIVSSMVSGLDRDSLVGA